MKRIAVRLSALTAVLSLGTFAVVQAQRSSQRAVAEVATAEPALLDVDEANVKPMPEPTPLNTVADRYPPRDLRETVPAAAAVDPFQAGSAAVQPDETTLGSAEIPPLPQAEDPQGIPPASEAVVIRWCCQSRVDSVPPSASSAAS